MIQTQGQMVFSFGFTGILFVAVIIGLVIYFIWKRHTAAGDSLGGEWLESN